MRQELIDKLWNDFPTLFGQAYKYLTGSYIPTKKEVGFHVGDGWEPDIRKACEKLAALSPEIAIGQIKEKFSGLRISCAYPEGLSEATWDICSEAALEVSTKCEECGQPGVVRRMSWIKVLCDEHAKGFPPLCKSCTFPFTELITHSLAKQTLLPQNCPDCNQQLMGDDEYQGYLKNRANK